MADFPPNLDDGEMYLPSDIFPDELVCGRLQPPRRVSGEESCPHIPSELTYMEDLANQLASFALLEPSLSQPPPNALQFRAVHSQRSSPVLETRPAAPGRGGPLLSASRSDCDLCHAQPCSAQLRSIMEARARVLRKQQQEIAAKNRTMPIRVGFRSRFFGRDYGGTGVFLPRASPTSDPPSKNALNKGTEHQPPMGKAGMQSMRYQHPSSDVGLPQDRTY